MKQRRNIEIFSLSFLDCVCCGFGALILLLVLSKTAEPIIFEEFSKDLDKVVVDLHEKLHEIRGETHVLNRELVSKKEQIALDRGASSTGYRLAAASSRHDCTRPPNGDARTRRGGRTAFKGARSFGSTPCRAAGRGAGTCCLGCARIRAFAAGV